MLKWPERHCVATAVLTLLGLAAHTAWADEPLATIGELKRLTLEDLMNVEVTSVARHPEKLISAASAIQVITREDIRRSGATSLPEALRLASNLQVAQKNSHDWGISARGFNTDLANKLLVMVDGRTVYTPLYSGVFWDAQDYLLEDIDRIEVISGPGGAQWGANAVNGVINIITRNAHESPGLYLEAGGGRQPEDLAGVRYGGQWGDSAYRVYGKYFDRGSEVLANGGSSSDRWRQGRVGFRVDSEASSRDTLTAQGDLYTGHENQAPGVTSDLSGENLLARWSRVFDEDSDFALQSYIDRTHLSNPVGPLTIANLVLSPPGVFVDDLTTYDLDFQHRFRFGPFGEILWGLGYRHTHDAVGNAPALGFLPDVLNQSLYSAFLQDELPLGKRLTLSFGTKVEHNDYTGLEFEPSARLSFTPSSADALWAAVSRAVRTPSRIDHDLSEGVPPYLVILKGGADFSSERVVAYELGYRAEISPKLTVAASTFFNQYGNVRSASFTAVTILPFYFANNVEGDTDGAELSAAYAVSDGWTLHAGYDLLKEHLHVRSGAMDLNAALNETADPQHQLSLRSSLDLPHRVEFDTMLRWVDTLHNNNGPTIGTVPSYFELNARLGWHASDRLELSLVGDNLLHAQHPEYGFPAPTRVEIQRSVYAKAVWRY